VSLGALLFAFQYVTMPKFGLLPPAVSYSRLSVLLQQVQAKIEWSLGDALIFAAIVATVVAILIDHTRSGVLTRCVAWCTASEKRSIGTVVAVSTVAVRFYFSPGQVAYAADAGPHIAYAWVASQSIANWELPIWTNYFGAGSPFCQFYGFLFYYAVGFVNLLVRDLDTALKLTMALGHVGSGVAMYALARTMGHRRAFAIVAGLAYVLTLWHTQQTVVMGRPPVSWVYALIPVAFAYTVLQLRDNRLRPE